MRSIEIDFMPKLLIVTNTFAPSQVIGGRRCERIAGFLASHGWSVEVLAPAIECLEPPINTAIPIPENVVVHRMRGMRLRNVLKKKQNIEVAASHGFRSRVSGNRDQQNSFQRMRSYAKSIGSNWKEFLLRNVEFPDKFIGLKKDGMKLVKGRDYHVVLASIPAWSSAFLAKDIARRCGARLVLDYRDPWSDLLENIPTKTSKRLLHKHARLEQSCLDEARLVIGVSPTICRWLHVRGRRPTFLIPNSFQMHEAKSHVGRRRQRKIVYAGSLSYGRSLLPVLKALRFHNQTAQHPIILEYFGPHCDKCREEARAADSVQYLSTKGTVPYAEVQDSVKNAAAAVVIVSPDYRYAIPGKLFECLAYLTPPLLIAPIDADATSLVKYIGFGSWHEYQDTTGIARTLQEIPTLPNDLGRLSSISDSSMMPKLERLLKRLSALPAEHEFDMFSTREYSWRDLDIDS